MSHATSDRTARRRSARRAEGSPPRRRVSVVGVFGELLITAGVLVFLYVGWQLWLGDVIYGAQANAEGAELSETWAEQYEPTEPAPSATPDDTADPAAVEPVVLPEPQGTEDFAVMRVPRFGDDYAVTMAGGVTRAGTLDRARIGHYPGSKMPGEVGNFAVAAHRTTYGAPFNRIAELRVGDAIVVETEAGWYTYRFRTLEYVTPDEVEVLLPVPQEMDAPAGTRYLTMTSCSPLYSLAERIVAYSVFESFTPRSDGPPSSLIDAAGA
ncbi:class E sortase [Microbacterium sp. ARD31]|uniref:class E sortase n=1 Tax=Microbacterium sp. ARD31 TaxID=2962576 RepID=UPI002880D094|nr:class E sortase [Microbacterium sp. ARD31]MDT0182567.1 class E sortase [Microbacterium sp. ARD31]